MKLLKISAIMLVICILFSACAPQNTETASSEPKASEPASSEVVSSNPLRPEKTNEYGDILRGIENVGTTVTAYGKLKDAKYKASLDNLEKILDDYSHTVSVVAYSLDNSGAVCYNTSAELFCACTVKAAYTLYCLKQMESGKATLDTEMTYEQKHYEPGTGDMQYSPVGTKFTMRTILDKTMRISDNVGYMMATDYFGREDYNKWIKNMGCASLQISPTVWSLHAKAKDLAVVWNEIYEYFGSESEYSKFFYDSCTNTPNNYATAALENIDCSHKQGNNRTGKWLAYSDAGIVWKAGSPYIIVILTDAPGPSNYDAEMMAKVIKIVNNELF